MRLFVAIEVPPALQEVLANVGRQLDPGGSLARWVSAGSIHLTLRFLGEVDPKRTGAIEQALSVLRASELTLRIHGIGFFPRRRAPRVLWAGVSGEGLCPLALAVDLAMERIGLGRESKPFRPHLTLARARGKGTIGSDLVRAAPALESADFGSFRARSTFLYRSRSDRGGAVYERIAEAVFARNAD